MIVGFVVDPLDGLHYHKDSTVLMMQTALACGYRVWVWQDNTMTVQAECIRARVTEINRIDIGQANWYQGKVLEHQDLTQCQVVMMRKDPPVNLRFLYATHTLSLLEQQGVRVVNRPQALREYNEKLSILKFPQAITDTLISADQTALREFLAIHHDVILKPLDGMGGASIYRLRENDPNITVIVEHLTGSGTQPIMAQRYLPEIQNGDCRVLVIDGEPVEYVVARLAKSGETRANLAAGGHAQVRPLTARQRELGQMIGAVGKADGLTIIGLDVIGDYVTEINVTCPTCMREIEQAQGFNVAEQIFSSLLPGC
jgi:glutathione synthase